MRMVPAPAEVGKQLRCEAVMRGSMSISLANGHISVRQAGIGESQVCLAGLLAGFLPGLLRTTRWLTLGVAHTPRLCHATAPYMMGHELGAVGDLHRGFAWDSLHAAGCALVRRYIY